MPLTPDTPIRDYFQTLEEPLKSKLLRRERRFRQMGYFTLGSFESAFNIVALPDYGRSRSLVADADSIYSEALDHNSRTRQMAKQFRLSSRDVGQLSSSTTKLSSSLDQTRLANSIGYFGCSERRILKANRSFRIVTVKQLKYRIPESGKERWLLPDIQTRLGGAWDQGNRSTCTAFAVTGACYYIHPYGTRPAPQFLYHQCKMIDGRPAGPGTPIESALRILADTTVSGDGVDWGTADCGVPDEKTWPYIDDDMPGNEAQTPPPSDRIDEIYGSYRWGSLAGEVIQVSTGNRIVDEMRILLRSAQIPVTVGLETFSSWNNLYTYRTGYITVPLAGDKNDSRHAMLVCGYDDADEIFLVRNSWGTDWGYENPWGMPGYALIPYQYFRQYCHNAYSIRHVSVIPDIEISEESRLYSKIEPGTRNINSGPKRQEPTEHPDANDQKTGIPPPRTPGINLWRRLRK